MLKFVSILFVAQYLTPSREFPKGRWFNHTVDKKDAWVANSVITHIAQQIGYERNKTMKRLNRVRQLPLKNLKIMHNSFFWWYFCLLRIGYKWTCRPRSTKVLSIGFYCPLLFQEASICITYNAFRILSISSCLTSILTAAQILSTCCMSKCVQELFLLDQLSSMRRRHGCVSASCWPAWRLRIVFSSLRLLPCTPETRRWIAFSHSFTTDMTMPTCRSACENFFKACNYQSGGCEFVY